MSFGYPDSEKEKQKGKQKEQQKISKCSKGHGDENETAMGETQAALRETVLSLAAGWGVHLTHLLGYAGAGAEQDKLLTVLRELGKRDADVLEGYNAASLTVAHERAYLGMPGEDSTRGTGDMGELSAVCVECLRVVGATGDTQQQPPLGRSRFTSLVQSALWDASDTVRTRPTPADLWLALLASKTLMYVYGDYQAAYALTRRVLGVCGVGSGCMAYDIMTRVGELALRSEALLLTGDQHEATGNLSSCLSYLAEAIADSGCSFSEADTNSTPPQTSGATLGANLGLRVAQMVALSALRIWYRTGSTAFASTLTRLLGVTGGQHEGKHASPLLLPEVQAAATAIACLTSDTEQGSALAGLDFRHLNLVWTSDLKHVCALPHALRNSLADARREASMLATSESTPAALVGLSGLTTNTCAPASLSVLQGQSTAAVEVYGLPFDVHRQLRRQAAVQLLRTQTHEDDASTDCELVLGGNDRGFLPFLLTCASMGTSTECALDSKSSQASPHSGFFAHVARVGREVNAACAGDNNAMASVHRLLTQMLIDLGQTATQADAGEADRPCSTESAGLVALTLDDASDTLLVARMTQDGALTAALPLGGRVRVLLKEWTAAMSANKEQLRQTHDAALLATWTDVEKKAWWKAREETDANLKRLLGEFQSVLGVWRLLLLPTQPLEDGVGVVGEGVVRTLDACFGAEGAEEASLCLVLPGRRTNDAWHDVVHWLVSGGDGSGGGHARSTVHALCLSEALKWVRAVLGTLSTAKDQKGLSAREAEIALSVIVTQTRTCITAGVGTVHQEETTKNSAVVTGLVKSLIKARITDCADAHTAQSRGCKKVPNAHPGDTAATENDQSAGNSSSNSNSNSSGNGEDNDSEELEESLRALKVTELRSQLKAKKLVTTGKKEDLIHRLHTASKNARGRDGGSSKEQPKRSQTQAQTQAQSHVVLLLDEQLQGLPWECLECLASQKCSRLPSISLMLALASRSRCDGGVCGSGDDVHDDELGVHGIDASGVITVGTGGAHSPLASPVGSPGGGSPTLVCDDDVQVQEQFLRTTQGTRRELCLEKCWYAIDPEDNLPTTRKTMQGFLSPFSSLWGWRGVVGQIPGSHEVKALHESSDLFIYCGHGAGERLCDSHSLRKYHTPAALLWGCSSGRLVPKGVHDPSGAAVSYLLGGAPWVIGNLWDVTDKDIDRLSMACMDALFSKQQLVPPAEGLKRSRGACKMVQLVGCAPVMYGLPVGFQK